MEEMERMEQKKESKKYERIMKGIDRINKMEEESEIVWNIKVIMWLSIHAFKWGLYAIFAGFLLGLFALFCFHLFSYLVLISNNFIFG